MACIEGGLKMRKDITDNSRWKAKSRQTKVEMARPGERGYGKNQMPTHMAEGR